MTTPRIWLAGAVAVGLVPLGAWFASDVLTDDESRAACGHATHKDATDIKDAFLTDPDPDVSGVEIGLDHPGYFVAVEFQRRADNRTGGPPCIGGVRVLYLHPAPFD